MAHISAYLKTPINAVEDMWWDDVLLWNHEARRIHNESFGLLASLLARK
ncbi:conserved hypothetical protein [Agrobacterium genomosp. 2 str. CFBP 5494]|uniref:Uncharacterized protein n=1 Tax=Agrobacterium genomosp. 2 str. CFBP 5494 TaxID=1183436 RepID=A0A9W5F2V9_9HYPH|nr:conserved hypothetical protein [Agrobacterium genomosp. 2 str. CFBP 5494]